MKNPKLWQVSEITISYQSKLHTEGFPSVKSTTDAENIFRENWSDDIELVEEFVVLFMTKANKVTGLFRVSRGSSSAVLVDVKIVFAAAVKAMAAGIIVAHNHPSGVLRPSQSDLDITQKLQAGSKLLDIVFFDHIILAPHHGCYSFADAMLF